MKRIFTKLRIRVLEMKVGLNQRKINNLLINNHLLRQKHVDLVNKVN